MNRWELLGKLVDMIQLDPNKEKLEKTLEKRMRYFKNLDPEQYRMLYDIAVILRTARRTKIITADTSK